MLRELRTSVINKLKAATLSVATAESCTGGRVAAELTAVSGASAVFQGGVVAYQNEVKSQILKVDSRLIDSCDVVSEEVAKAMVVGACQLFSADIAVATTGYAGPTGGSEKVPLGTIWIACGNGTMYLTKCLHLGIDRESNLMLTVQTALQLLDDFISELTNNNK